MKSLCFNLFVIDSVRLIGRECRKLILPFCPEAPYVRKNYKAILKIKSFNVST